MLSIWYPMIQGCALTANNTRCKFGKHKQQGLQSKTADCKACTASSVMQSLLDAYARLMLPHSSSYCWAPRHLQPLLLQRRLTKQEGGRKRGEGAWGYNKTERQ